MSIRHNVLPTITSCVFSGVNPRAGGFVGLLDQYTGASAAYSLRKLSSSATNAVRIRRVSDDVEVDVGFSGNAVSTSSPITNVSGDSGDTSATTLGSFLEEATPARNRTGTARYDTFTTDGVTGFTAERNGLAACGFDIAGTSGTDVNVSFDVTLNSGTVFVKLRPDFETGSDVSNEVEITSSGSKSFTLTSNADFKAMLFITAAADFVVSNFSVNVPYNHTATVTTWYDQSGNSRNAPQSTTGEQPIIASSGVLETDANGKPTLLFDGTDDDFDLPTTVITSLDSVSAFNVCSSLNTSGTKIALGISRTQSGGKRHYLPVLTSTKFYHSYDTPFAGGGTPTDHQELADADTNQHLFSSVAGSSTAKGFFDGTEKFSKTSVNTYASNRSGGIGSSDGGTNWQGDISEIIIYNSDQTSDFDAINTKIKSYYGIS